MSNKDFLARAYALGNPAEARVLYDEWSTVYDKDMSDAGYESPQQTVDAVLRHHAASGADSLTILDAGCGTGLVADCFKKSTISHRCEIEGLDLTQAMLDVAARKNTYKGLEIADLTKRIDRPDDSYEVVTCIGTLTKGHVGPGVLREFARVARKGGIIVCSVHSDIWESRGYKTTVEELRDQNVIQIVGTEKFEMFSNADEPGRLVVLKKL